MNAVATGISAAIFALAQAVAAQSQPTAGDSPGVTDMLPVEAFARLPDTTDVQLSPSGRYLSFRSRTEVPGIGRTTVKVYDTLDNRMFVALGVTAQQYSIRWTRWANEKYLLISIRFGSTDRGMPTEERRLLKADFRAGEISNVLPKSAVRMGRYTVQHQDCVIDTLPDDDAHILMATGEPATQIALRVSLETDDLEVVHRRKRNVRRWLADREGRIRVAVSKRGTSNRILVKDASNSKWSNRWSFKSHSLDSVWPLGFDSDPNLLYFTAHHVDRLAVFRLNLADEAAEAAVVATAPKHDIAGELLYSQKTRRAVGVSYPDGGGYSFWDEDYQRLQAAIDRQLPDTMNYLLSNSADEMRYVVKATSLTQAGRYYLWDRATKTLTRIGYRHKALPPEKMASVKTVTFTADGTVIEALLTRPNEAAAGPMPAIVFPHSEAQRHPAPSFSHWTQYFASRGFVALQFQFRHSEGYPFEILQAGLKDAGVVLQSDLEDATRWLIDKGIADPSRICVVGRASGAYAALMEAAEHPELYRCIVSYAGVTDLLAYVDSHKRYVQYDEMRDWVGSTRKTRRLRSPINLAGEISASVLLAHGTGDPNVPAWHSQKMHTALRTAGADVTYIEQENGDHHLSREDHRLEFFGAVDEFLKRHLTSSVREGVAGGAH